VWGIELGQGLEGEVGGDPDDADGHGQVKRDGQEVGFALVAGFLLGAEDGLMRGQLFPRVADLSQELAIRDAFGVQDQIGRPLVITSLNRGGGFCGFR
jgi:hypothetical protein